MGIACLYHTDHDGECAAAIVYRALPDVTCLPVNYNLPLPWEAMESANSVAIVDFSLQPDDWRRLLERPFAMDDVTWIDHHVTAIEASKGQPWELLPGRRDTRLAACRIAWHYFNTGQALPLAVELIGDRDTWRFEHGDDTRQFHAALMVAVDTRPYSAHWDDLLHGNSAASASGQVAAWLGVGRLVMAKTAIADAERIRDWGFEVIFQGWRCLAYNGQAGSEAFAAFAEGYELLLPHRWDGTQWTVSLYRGPAAPEADCQAIAKAYGGGGHPGAAGFQCAELPWDTVRRLREAE